MSNSIARKLVISTADTLRITADFFTRLGQRVIAIIWVTVIGGLVASATAVAAYLIYSGAAINMLAQIMAWACQAAGSCSDFSAMLAGTAVGIVLLLVLVMVIFISFTSLSSDDGGPNVDDISLIALLLDWYRIGPRERGALLEKLDGSDIDTSDRVRRLLYHEHRELEALDGDC